MIEFLPAELQEALHRLREVEAAHKEVLSEMKDGGEIIPAATAKQVERLLLAAQAISPYLYGVLQGAHRGTVTPEPDGATGRLFIDPSVVHPVLGGRPVVYGTEIHNEDRPWMQTAFAQLEDSIAQGIIDDTTAAVEFIFRQV